MSQLPELRVLASARTTPSAADAPPVFAGPAPPGANGAPRLAQRRAPSSSARSPKPERAGAQNHFAAAVVGQWDSGSACARVPVSHCPSGPKLIPQPRPTARVGSWSLDVIPALTEAYVQEVADGHPGEQASVIAPGGVRAPFARAARGRASYDWRYSTDAQGWFFGPRTVRADVRLHGLVPAALYSFQYRAVTKDGVSAWNQVVSLRVA